MATYLIASGSDVVVVGNWDYLRAFVRQWPMVKDDQLDQPTERTDLAIGAKW